MFQNLQTKYLVGAVFVLLAVLAGAGFLAAKSISKPQPILEPAPEVDDPVFVKKEIKEIFLENPLPVPPPDPDMERMKKQGCVTDGLLSGYGDDDKNNAELIKRSDCYYLHRALETWLSAPDFKKAQKMKDRIGKKDVVYGMFIAEAIDTKAKLYYPQEKRDFDFSAMCRKESSENYWGEHTCIPSFQRTEYRKYLEYVTSQAMEMGIQSFMFGQIQYQEGKLSEAIAPEIISHMKETAEFLGMKIVVGAQTNDIDDEEYLKNFDFIEGGVGLKSNGSFEDGPCFSRWWKKPGDWCWALLWNDRFSKKANNVFVHLDWSGKEGDDMSTFARMDDRLRKETLKKLHAYFMSKGDGFMLPMLAVLPNENGGCHADSKKFYSADNKYSCKDENTINAILKKSR